MLETESFIIKENDKIVERDIEIHTNCDIPDETVINFLSKDEIVEDLYSRLNDEDKKTIAEIDDVKKLQESTGKFIRSKYGLWLNPHPYSNNNNIRAENFADNISLEILKRLQARIKNKCHT